MPAIRDLPTRNQRSFLPGALQSGSRSRDQRTNLYWPFGKTRSTAMWATLLRGRAIAANFRNRIAACRAHPIPIGEEEQYQAVQTSRCSRGIGLGLLKC